MKNIFKVIAGQTSWQLLGKVTTSLSTIVILSLITRKFGEEGTGTFTLALTFMAFFTLAVDLGFNAYLLGKVSEEIFRKCLGLRLILASLLVLLAVTVAYFWPGNESFKQLVYFGAFFAIFEPAVFVTTNLIFQKNLAYNFSVKATILGSATILFGVMLAVYYNLPLPYLMLSYSTGWTIMALGSLIFVRKFISNLSPIIDLGFIKDVFIKSWPISVTLLLNVVYFRLDVFLLSIFKPIAEVGIYNLSYQIFQTIIVLPTFIMNSFYPLMLQSFAANKLKFLKELKISIGVMLILSLIGAGTTILLAPLLINIITGGKGFIGSSYSLQILALALPAFFVSSVLMWTFVTLKKYKSMLAIYTVGLLFNFSANYLLIPQYSYIASSYITGVSEYLVLFLQVMVLWRGYK